MASNGSNINLFVIKYSAQKLELEVLNTTFIRAFESSPVHCAKSLPSLKHRRPAYNGTAEMLVKLKIGPHMVSIIRLYCSLTVDQYHVLSYALHSRHA